MMKLDLSSPPVDFDAFGRGVWATLTNSKLVALSGEFPQSMAVLAIKAGQEASRKSMLRRSMEVKADQAVRLSQGSTGGGSTSDAARGWATRQALGVDGPQAAFDTWADQVGL